MTQTKKINWFKLIGLAFLLHIVLIVISILEVFVYSMIEPGKEAAFYESHAGVSGPWVSGIFGSLFIFFIVKRYIKKNYGQPLTYAIAFPFVYILWDIIILLPFQIDWLEHFPVLLMANGPKVAAGLLSFYIYKNKTDQ